MVVLIAKDLSSFHLPVLPSLACIVFLTITRWEEMGKGMKKRHVSSEFVPFYQENKSFPTRYLPLAA